MRTTLRLSLATGVATLLAACSQNPMQTGPSPLTAAPTASYTQADEAGAFGTAVLTPYSCPSDAPRFLRANPGDGDKVDLSWEGVPNVTRYTFEVEHLEGTRWVPAGGSQTYSTLADALVQSTYRATAGYGRYRVRVRNSRTVSCEELPNAQWSAWEEFSKDDPTRVAPPPPPPPPPIPVEEDDDDECGFGEGHPYPCPD